MSRLLSVLLFAACVSACTGSKAPPVTPEVAPPPPPGVKGEPLAELPPPPAEAAEETHQGTLKYTPLPPTMSVENYMGVEYTVGDVVLGASSAVSAEALQALDGKKVTVKCVPEAPVAEDDNMAHPIDQEGEALPRPAKCRVTSIKAD